MKKTFKAENKAAIEVELIDINGNKRELTGQYVSLEDQERISIILKDDTMDYIAKLLKSMVIYYGGKEEDYKAYDAKLLSAVIKYYGDEYSAQNPTQVENA